MVTQVQEQHIKLNNVPRSLRLLKQGIWVYFFLLIFEGALRKWFLPGLATPLLIIRDPLALWLILYAQSQNRLRANPYLLGMVFVGIFSLFMAVVVGHGSLPVALFGARILLLHFPMIFIIGTIFNYDDVIKLGKVTLWIAIPMTVLITLQFYSPQSAWVNRGLAGDEAGAGFSGALGYFRPPATFSFTNGTTLFFSLVACFVLFFWLDPGGINRIILMGSTTGLLAAIPLSISRALFYQVAVCIIFTIIAVSRKPKYAGRLALTIFGTFLAIILLSQLNIFQTSIEAFTARFEGASEHEGGVQGTLVGRFLGGMVNAINGNESSDLPFWGYGLGMGTNVGAQLIAGNRIFLIAEDEWARIIGELGLLLGLTVILIRLGLTAKIAIASYKRLSKGIFLPWMLASFGIVYMAQGGWAQPTSLGFFTLIGGLMLASLQNQGK